MARDSFDDEPIEEIDEVEEIDDVEEVDEVEPVDDVEEIDDDDDDARGPRPSRFGAMKNTLRLLFRGEPARPGEHDIVRSPVVLWLTIGVFILTITGGIFWFIIARETAQRKFDAAMAEMNAEKYSQAIKLFDDFLQVHTRHPLAQDVYIEQGRAYILREITGTSPSYSPGLEQLQNFITANRDKEEFPELTVSIAEYAQTISVGAAETAESAQDAELLEVSRNAFNVLKRYSGESGVPAALEKQIYEKQQDAEQAIFRKKQFEDGLAEIEEMITGKNSIGALKARRALMERNELFAQAREMGPLLTKTLDLEKSLVERIDESKDALTDDYPMVASKPLSVTLNARSTTSDTAGSRYVYVIGQDTLYGIEAVTGSPVWRRVIGLNTPFFPIEVKNPVPSLLVFNTRHSELMLIDRQTGALIWRQSVGGMRAAEPLIHQGQIYLPTQDTADGGVEKHFLFKIGLESGRITSRVAFQQPIFGPPALSADERHVVIPGEQEVVYTLSLAPLQCQDVAFLGHQQGSVRTPITTMGRLFLFVENNQSGSSRLHVLRGGEDAMDLAPTTTDENDDNYKVDGQVLDKPIMRSNILFIPSNPQRITAFTVSDDPDQPPLTKLAATQIPEVPAGPMNLYAGPANQLWLFSRSLRRFELQTDNINLTPGEDAVGFATQPVQSIGEKFFLGRQPPYAKSTFFTQTDRQELSGFWKTTVGTQILATVTPADDAMVAVTDSGDVFRLSSDEITSGGFKQDTTVQIRLNDKLVDPVGAVRLDDERIAIYAGRPEPALWVTNRLGQVKRSTLPGPLETDPVALPKGIVVALSGRLSMTGRSTSSARVSDYRVKIEPGQQPPRWKWLVRTDDTHVIAFDDRNRMIKVQYREQPRPTLAYVALADLESPVDVRPVVHNGRLYLANAGGKLLVLDSGSLDVLDQFQLPAPATSRPWVVGDRVFVEAGGNTLACFSTGGDARQMWQTDLGGNSLAGPPLAVTGTGYLLASRTGQIWIVDPDGGTPVGKSADIGQPLSDSARVLGGVAFVTSIDGSLYAIDQAMFVAAGE